MIKNPKAGELVTIISSGIMCHVDRNSITDNPFDGACNMFYQNGSVGKIIEITYPGLEQIAQNYQNRYHPPFIKVWIINGGFGTATFSPKQLERLTV